MVLGIAGISLRNGAAGVWSDEFALFRCIRHLGETYRRWEGRASARPFEPLFGRTTLPYTYYLRSIQYCSGNERCWLTPLIDALARPTVILQSKLLRRIPAPQVTSGFVEASYRQSLTGS